MFLLPISRGARLPTTYKRAAETQMVTTRSPSVHFLSLTSFLVNTLFSWRLLGPLLPFASRGHFCPSSSLPPSIHPTLPPSSQPFASRYFIIVSVNHGKEEVVVAAAWPVSSIRHLHVLGTHHAHHLTSLVGRTLPPSHTRFHYTKLRLSCRLHKWKVVYSYMTAISVCKITLQIMFTIHLWLRKHIPVADNNVISTRILLYQSPGKLTFQSHNHRVITSSISATLSASNDIMEIGLLARVEGSVCATRQPVLSVPRAKGASGLQRPLWRQVLPLTRWGTTQVLMAARLQFYSPVTHQLDRSLHSSADSPVWWLWIRVEARHLHHKALANSEPFWSPKVPHLQST